MTPTDGVVAALLLAFSLWGAVRGPWRPALSIVLLALAFAGGAWLGPVLRPWVERVAGLSPAETAALAWAFALFLVWLAGALLARVLGGVLSRLAAGGRAGRLAGALLGGLKGALVLLLAGHVLLAWPARPAPPGGPPLSRSSPAPTSASPGRPDWRAAARRSLAARWLVEGGRVIETVAHLPPWIEDAVARVRQQVETGS